MRRYWLTAAVLVAIGAAGSSRADDKAVRSTLDANYAKMVTALKHKDVKQMMAFTTPDFSMQEAGQLLDAKTTEKMLNAEVRDMKTVKKVTMSILKLQVKGASAVATVRSVMNVVIAGKGKPHDMDDTSVSEDTWVKTAQGWRMSRMKTIQETATIDGKPIPMPGAGPGK